MMTVYVITEQINRRHRDGAAQEDRFIVEVVDSEEKAINYIQKQIRSDAKFHTKYPDDLEFRYGKGATLEQYPVPMSAQIKEYQRAHSYFVKFHEGKDSLSKWYSYTPSKVK